MALHESALLVQLAISQYYNQVLDDGTAKKYAAAEGVNTDTMGVKFLRGVMPKGALSEVTAVLKALRTYHYTVTMPWSDGNQRLLPSAEYFKYVQRVNEYQARLGRALEHVVLNLDVYRNQARAAGAKFVDEEFPTAEHLRGRFQVRITFHQIPSVGDFRLKQIDGDIERVKDQLRLAMADQVRGSAQKHLVTLYGRLSFMVMRLKDPQAKIFSSVLDSLRSTAELGKSLEGVAPDLGTYSTDTLNVLDKFTTDDLRNDDGKRAEAARALDSITTQLRISHGYGSIAGAGSGSAEEEQAAEEAA